jgi:hypothetical protein
MIGHMILRKNVDGEDILGLKVTGGKILANDNKGAIIEKVKKGSIAEQEGHIRPGKILTIFLGLTITIIISFLILKSSCRLMLRLALFWKIV